MNLKVVIMAGGKGTRIATINSDVPKPMIPILNKPILEYQIETLKKAALGQPFYKYGLNLIQLQLPVPVQSHDHDRNQPWL